MSKFSIYVHIPYCQHKCPYCDFNTYAVTAIPEKEYTAALISELDYRASLAAWRGGTVQSIYFGGGTPSLFSPSSVAKFIRSVLLYFEVLDNIEITLEANPGTVSLESLAGYREAGVNRLSFGSQSLNVQTLKALGRTHTPEQTEVSVSAARQAGFRNINLDLMYGAPGQTVEDLVQDISDYRNIAPEHISPYGLTLEKGTPLYAAARKGAIKLPVEEQVIEMMQQINHRLPAAGLARYEISNFAKPGFEAKHNLIYWNGDDYIGLGAGAHSYLRTGAEQVHSSIFGERWSNFALPTKYIEQTAGTGRAEAWSEKLSWEDAVFEFFFLGLRKISGVNLKEFEERFGASATDIYAALLPVLEEEGLITLEKSQLALTDRGLMLADSVIENFSEVEKRLVQPRAVGA